MNNILINFTAAVFILDGTLRTLVAVLFVAVVHAVQDIVAAPAPRDAVRSVQTQELVFAALLHTADLSGVDANHKPLPIRILSTSFQ